MCNGLGCSDLVCVLNFCWLGSALMLVVALIFVAWSQGLSSGMSVKIDLDAG